MQRFPGELWYIQGIMGYVRWPLSCT